jgi:hypothetical protein
MTIDNGVLDLLLGFSLFELFLILDSFWREVDVASFLKILDIDILLFLFIDLLHAFPSVN